MSKERALTNIAAIFGVITALFAIYGALTFSPIRKYSSTLEICDPEYSSWLDLIDAGRASNGDVMLLEMRVLFGNMECHSEYLFREEISNQGHDEVIYSLTPRSGNAMSISQRQRAYQQNLLTDNGTTIHIRSGPLRLNPLSRTMFDVEGLEDRFSGPFQVEFDGEDGASWLVFTPPILTDSLDQRVKCAEKDWGFLLRALFCQML